MVDTASDGESDRDVIAAGRRSNTLAAFTDIGFRTSTAYRVVPLLYRCVLVGVVVFYVCIAAIAVRVSLALGLFWLIVAGPAVCIAVVLVTRTLLELVLAVLKMGERFEETNETVLEIAELMVGISAKIEVLPTLPTFGRGVRSRRRAAIADARERIVARKAAVAGADDTDAVDTHND